MGWMNRTFGFRFKRDDTESKNVESFASPEKQKTTVDTHAFNEFSSFLGHSIDLDGVAQSENRLIEKYREVASVPEVDQAIQEIVNDAIVTDRMKQSVTINLDSVDIPENIKKEIYKSFNHVYGLLNFQNRGHDIFRQWYVDSRINYDKLIDMKRPRDGVKGLRFIDPKKIKAIREYRDNAAGSHARATLYNDADIHEYYIYNENGIEPTSSYSKGANSSYSGSPTQAIKISTDRIAHCNSGRVDPSTGITIGHLHKVIRASNNLRMLEDSVIIYRLSRAPERRVFYIDTGNATPGKAEQYMRQIQAKHKNKLVYDVKTGDVRDDKRHMAMTEDYWLPRSGGGKGTQIETLPSGQNLGEMDDVNFFKEKLYTSLNVPKSRFSQEGAMFGRGTEITRDELKFSKFIDQLRVRFSALFEDITGTDLVLRNIMSLEEWNELKTYIRYDFLEDNHFSEMFENEVLQSRLAILRDIEEYRGTYFSKVWVQKNVLRMTEENIKDEEEQMDYESEQEAGQQTSEQEPSGSQFG